MKSGRNSKISEATTPDPTAPAAKLTLKQLEAIDSDEIEDYQIEERDKLRHIEK